MSLPLFGGIVAVFTFVGILLFAFFNHCDPVSSGLLEKRDQVSNGNYYNALLLISHTPPSPTTSSSHPFSIIQTSSPSFQTPTPTPIPYPSQPSHTFRLSTQMPTSRHSPPPSPHPPHPPIPPIPPYQPRPPSPNSLPQS